MARNAGERTDSPDVRRIPVIDFPSLLRLAEAVGVDASSGLLWTHHEARLIGGQLVSVAAWTLRGGAGVYSFCDYPPDLEATLSARRSGTRGTRTSASSPRTATRPFDSAWKLRVFQA